MICGSGNGSSTAEVVFEAWTIKKSKHFKTKRNRYCVLKSVAPLKAVLETYESDKKLTEPTESIDLSHESVIILKKDAKKFRIHPKGIAGPYRAFETESADI